MSDQEEFTRIEERLDGHQERIALLEQRQKDDHQLLLEVKDTQAKIALTLGRTATTDDVAQIRNLIHSAVVDQAKDQAETARQALAAVPQEYANKQLLAWTIVGVAASILVAIAGFLGHSLK